MNSTRSAMRARLREIVQRQREQGATRPTPPEAVRQGVVEALEECAACHVELRHAWLSQPALREARVEHNRRAWRELARRARVEAEVRRMSRERAEDVVGQAAAMCLRLEGFRLALELTGVGRGE